MPMEFKNYYDVLGVPRTASDAEIKKAFRSLARKHHPDVAKDKAQAESRFREINEANEVLSDPEKRREYDELREHWTDPTQRGTRRGGGFRPAPEAGAGVHFDGTGFSDFFEQFFGSRGRRPEGDGMGMWENRAEGEPIPQRGQDVEGSILVTLAEVLAGSLRMVQLQRTDPRTGQATLQTLRVNIPPGVRDGQLIRLAGKGGEGIDGGAAGHLYLRVALAKHPDFRVRGATLYHDLELSPWEAVLGATVDIPSLDGRVSMKIPAGTTAEREFRLRGKGLPNGNGTRGDLHVVVGIQVPSQLTTEQKAVWEQLAALSAFNPRSAT